MDERELVARCVSGQEEAWRELVAAYDSILRHLARSFLRSLNSPSDDGHVDEIRSGVLEMLVAHDFRILRSFRWQCSFETWLRVIVRTVCVRSVRGKKLDPREVPTPMSAPSPLESALTEERARAVQSALDGLPERERRVLSMFFVDGRSYREISDALKLPMGTIATLLARTREKLRAMLEARGM